MEVLSTDPHSVVVDGAIAPSYDYRSIAPTTGAQITMVYTWHHENGGLPDYLKAMLEDADVFVPELPGWTPQFEKLLTRVAKGDYSSLQKVISMGNGNAYNDEVMRAVYGSKVKVSMVDYKAGTFDFKQASSAMSRFGSTATHPVMKRREQHMLEKLSQLVNNMGGQQGSDKPLKVVGTFGYLHLGMTDGLVQRNSLEGGLVGGSVGSMFEDSLAGIPAEVVQYIKDYQEWLRTGP